MGFKQALSWFIWVSFQWWADRDLLIFINLLPYCIACIYSYTNFIEPIFVYKATHNPPSLYPKASCPYLWNCNMPLFCLDWSDQCALNNYFYSTITIVSLFTFFSFPLIIFTAPFTSISIFPTSSIAVFSNRLVFAFHAIFAFPSPFVFITLVFAFRAIFAFPSPFAFIDLAVPFLFIIPLIFLFRFHFVLTFSYSLYCLFTFNAHLERLLHDPI